MQYIIQAYFNILRQTGKKSIENCAYFAFFFFSCSSTKQLFEGNSSFMFNFPLKLKSSAKQKQLPGSISATQRKRDHIVEKSAQTLAQCRFHVSWVFGGCNKASRNSWCVCLMKKATIWLAYFYSLWHFYRMQEIQNGVLVIQPIIKAH